VTLVADFLHGADPDGAAPRDPTPGERKPAHQNR